MVCLLSLVELTQNSWHKLYLKYVAMLSEFEINVSYRTRLAMDKIFATYHR